MLHYQLVIVTSQIVRRFDGNIVQYKGTDNRINCADAELMEILCAQSFGDAQQPFDVIAIRWIACILGLWTIIVHAPRQCLHSQHAHIVGGKQITQLC